MANLKLFIVLLGSKPADRIVEQHDYYFGIATDIKSLIPDIKEFWPQAGSSLHIDGWREINFVDNYKIEIALKGEGRTLQDNRLFFINLGGYQSRKLEEQHHIMLTVQDGRLPAVKEAMKSLFYKTNSIKGAHAHIDEKYGIDVDEIYRIEDVLNLKQKHLYDIIITESAQQSEDVVHLGYFKLNKF